MAQKNFMIKNGLRVGDSDLFVTSGGTTVKGLTVGNVSIPSTIGSDNQILKVVSGSLAFASVAEIEDSDLTKVANLQNKVDGLINRLDSDDADRQIGTLVVDSDGQILLNTNDDVANSGTLTIDSDGQILFLTGNDTLDSVGGAILSLRADRDSDSSKLAKISEITNRLDSDSAAIQSLATKTRADLDSDSIIIQSLKAATNTNTANIAGLGGIDSDHTFQTLTVNNTTTDDSILVTTTEDSNNAGPVITLKRNSSSVADADYLGQIKFKGENDANQEIVYAKITGKIQDASDGTEDGIIEITHKKAGSNNISARFNSDTLQLINGTGLEVDGTVTVGNGLTLTDGNVIVANGHGIDFSATSDATGMTGELLDDYEEGIYTPTVTGRTSGSYTLGDSATKLSYVKIGRMVHLQGQLHITGESSPNGVIDISLPFATGNGADLSDRSVGSVAFDGVGAQGPDHNSGNFVNFYVSTDASVGSFRSSENNTSAGTLNNSHMATNDRFTIGITYMTF